jgi:hypothetical protein
MIILEPCLSCLLSLRASIWQPNFIIDVLRLSSAPWLCLFTVATVYMPRFPRFRSAQVTSVSKLFATQRDFRRRFFS